MWEIYAYQNADSLFGIFNAAATIHGSGDYMAAVAAVALQRVHRGAGGLRLRAREAAGLEVAGHRAAGVCLDRTHG
jgi:hypothetical protein